MYASQIIICVGGLTRCILFIQSNKLVAELFDVIYRYRNRLYGEPNKSRKPAAGVSRNI